MAPTGRWRADESAQADVIALSDPVPRRRLETRQHVSRGNPSDAPAPRSVDHVTAPRRGRGLLDRARRRRAGTRIGAGWAGAVAPLDRAVHRAGRGVGRSRSQRSRGGPDHGRADRRLGRRRASPVVPGGPRAGPADPGDDPGRRAAGPDRRRRLPGRLRTARQRRPDRPVAGPGSAVDRHRARRLVAGRGGDAGAGRATRGRAERPDPEDRPGADGRGGGLVGPRRGDGGVDPRTGRRPHKPGQAVRAEAVRPAGKPGAGSGSTAPGSPPSGCSPSRSARPSSMSAGWCPSCSTPSGPGVACSC